MWSFNEDKFLSRINAKSVVSGIFGGGGEAKSAARAQERATQAGIAEQRRQFDITQEQLAPFREAGVGALQQQQQLLGLLGPEQQAAAFGAFQESPGQAFLRQRGERSLLRGASAIGGLGGGNIREALVQQGIGFAGQQLGEFQNRLAALSGTGQTAAQNVAQLGQQTAGQISGLLQAGGQAQASGILGAQQARAGLGQQVLGAGLGAAAGGGLFGAGAAGLFGGSAGAGLITGLIGSDKNIKHDINELDLEACFEAVLSMPLKSWRYLEEIGLGQDIHFGPMSQEAPEMIKVSGKEMLDLHSELMMIAGAIQYMKKEEMLNG